MAKVPKHWTSLKFNQVDRGKVFHWTITKCIGSYKVAQTYVHFSDSRDATMFGLSF